jgi:hypothetical protein
VNRDEYLILLATAPATPAQIGVIISEFDRLGITDRGERLAISAALLELDGLGSTCDLVMGQAGALVRILRDTPDRASLPDVATAAGNGSQHQGANLSRGAPGDQTGADSQNNRSAGSRVTVAAAIRDLIVAAVIIFGRVPPAEPPAASAEQPDAGAVETPPERAVVSDDSLAADAPGKGP